MNKLINQESQLNSQEASGTWDVDTCEGYHSLIRHAVAASVTKRERKLRARKGAWQLEGTRIGYINLIFSGMQFT